MEQELRQMFEMRETDMTVPPTLPSGLRNRIRRQRMVIGGLVAATAVAVVVGGFAGARALSSDEALPPVNRDSKESVFVDTWVTIDGDGSTPTMEVRATGEDVYEILIRDDFAGECSNAPSTTTGTGWIDDDGGLVIPSPVFTCDDGSEPEALSGPPLEEALRDLTFVHDPGSDTLEDNLPRSAAYFGSVWERRESGDEAPPCSTPPADPESLPEPECLRGEQLPDTEVANGSYEGTPWQLSVFTEPVIGVDHSEGFHSLGLVGSLGDDKFAFTSGIRPDSELEGTVGTKLFVLNDGLPDALVISGTATPDIDRVVFSEGGQTRSTKTIAVPEVGDDFRVFVMFVPFGTDVGCLQWEIDTVNCFGATQTVVGLDASGEVVHEEQLQPTIGRDCLVCSPIHDPDEFVTDGFEGGLKWRLSAQPYDLEWCFAFSLGARDAGGRGCLTRPGSSWFGEVGQRVEPQRPEIAPVYGAISTDVDEVEVELDDGGAIPARIFRPQNHSYAYYLAWIPDAFATGSVRFSADGDDLGALPLCAADHRNKSGSFVCYGAPETQ
jgi:hypothetical protein